MNNLKDIKDRSPNKNSIKMLEELLEEAKRGELRSIVYSVSLDDRTTRTGWSIDERCDKRLILADLVLTTNDFSDNILMESGGVVSLNIFNE